MIMIFYIKNEVTPEVNFDKHSRTLNITGISYPEYPRIFFDKLLILIHDLQKINNEHFDFKIQLDYLNASSVKTLYNIFKEIILKSKIIWLHDEEDEYIKELGLIFQTLLGENFKVELFVRGESKS